MSRGYQQTQPPSHAIIIGLDADMSSGSAEAGEAIRRGIALAIDEINRAGGVLGRPFHLVVRDHRGNPSRGVDNIEAFAQLPNLMAVVGGIHTPVALAELESLHRHQIIYLDPWAAGTPIISNGYTPNYAFRVSVRDEYAGPFLIEEILRLGYRHPGLLLEQTGWGRSNEKAFQTALHQHGLKPVGTEWFHWGIGDMAPLIESLKLAGSDVILLVSNPQEGIRTVQAMANRPADSRLPIISHWGITGAGRRFFERVRDDLPGLDLRFLQTFSFLDPPFPKRGQRLFEAYRRMFPVCQSPRDIFSPVGTAHAYDLIHLLALAIQQANRMDRLAVRDALERLGAHAGVMRNYQTPFTTTHHDALTASDFRMAQFGRDGAIVPLSRKD